MDFFNILAWASLIVIAIMLVLFICVLIAICHKIIKAMDEEYIKGKLNKR